MSLGSDVSGRAHVARALALAGILDEAERDRLQKDDRSIDSVTRVLSERGYATSVRRLVTSPWRALPLGSVVELRSGGLGLVTGGDARSVEVDVGGLRRALPLREAGRILGRRVLTWARRADLDQSPLVSSLRLPEVASGLMRVLVLSMMMQLAALAGTLATRFAVAQAIADGARNTLLLVVIALLGFGLHAAWTSHIRQRAVVYIEVHLASSIVAEALRRRLDHPFAELERATPTDAHQQLQSADGWSRLASAVLVTSIDVILTGIHLVLLAWFSLAGALAALIVIAVVFSASMLLARGQRARRATMLNAEKERQRVVDECIAGIESIKSDGVADAMLHKLAGRLAAEHVAEVMAGEREMVSSALAGITDRALLSLLVLVLGLALVDGSLGPADAIAAFQASAGLAVGVQALARLPQRCADLSALGQRLGRRAPLRRTDGDVPPSGSSADAAIAIDNAWFRHQGANDWILKDFSIRIQHGEAVVLRWPSGAGKTTLLRVIAGLYEPTHGTVIVEGRSAALARGRVCYVPQGADLLPLSVLDNLKVFSGGAGFSRIHEAARATGLADIVARWPLGYESLLARGNANLSAGQRQLILLTAAVASDCPIVLLDETLSHIDHQIRDGLSLSALFPGRTVVSVEHVDASHLNVPPDSPAV